MSSPSAAANLPSRPRLPLSRLRNALLAVFAIAYGFVLQSLPLMAFKDRQNYLEYAQNATEILVAYAAQGPLVVLSNEPLWLLINIGLAYIGDPEFIMRTVIFVGAARFTYVLMRADPRNAAWLLLFMLMPQLLKNYLTHLRQGLAIAVFFSGYFASGPLRRWLQMLAAPFIHASFVFILPIIVLPGMLRRLRFGVDIRLLVMAAYALAASLSLGVLSKLVGARQLGDYDFAMTSVSGLGFVFWLGVFALFLLQGKTFLERHQRAAGILLLYLLSYFFVEVTARIFESGMPLVLLAGLALSGGRRWLFIGAFLSYSIGQWLLRLSTPMPF